MSSLAHRREFGLQHLLDKEEDTDSVTKEYLDDYAKLIRSLQIVGFRNETGINMILRVLVAVQLICQLNFKKDGDTHRVTNRDVLEMVANLLELEEDFLERALTQTNVMNEGSFCHTQEWELTN